MQEMKTKRERDKNWLKEDKLLLLQLINEKVDILEDKKTDTNTNQKKLNAWKTILNIFNSIAYSKRTISQLRGQWSRIKLETKSLKSKRKQMTVKTDDGPPSPSPPDCGAESESIEIWLPQTFVKEESFHSEDTYMNETVATPGTCDEFQPQSVFDKNKKNEEELTFQDILKNELNCRKELHKIQMENEMLKRDNLLREQRLIEEKIKKNRLQIENLS